ncbi:MAG: type II toxin-antitoxin system HicA family toxin [Terriglobales bacterium]
MPPLPQISGQDLVAALERFGYPVVRQKGSHVPLHGEGRSPVTGPLHPSLDRGTLRAILRAAEISVQEFIDGSR